MCFKCTYANNVSYVDFICLKMLLVNNGKNVLDDFGMQIKKYITLLIHSEKLYKHQDHINESIVCKPIFKMIVGISTNSHPPSHPSTNHNNCLDQFQAKNQKLELKAQFALKLKVKK